MSIAISALCESLAPLLEYPTARFVGQLAECRKMMYTAAPAVTEALAVFSAGTESLPLSALEELYIQTFDFNPKTTLDLGWQLFAEDYNRGLFLAKLRVESRLLGVPETHELPDHLPHVLRLLAHMEPAAATDFINACVLPAVTKTRDALDPTNPYHHLIQCTVGLLMVMAEATAEVTPP